MPAPASRAAEAELSPTLVRRCHQFRQHHRHHLRIRHYRQHQRDGDQQYRRQHHRRLYGISASHRFCQCDQFRQHHRHLRLRHSRRHQCDGDQQCRRQHHGRLWTELRQPRDLPMSPIPAASPAADSGIYAGTNATVTNNAGASIAGGQFGISPTRALPMSPIPAASPAHL